MRQQWFDEARFGMFVHFGLYSGAARHEWVQNYEFLTDEEYRQYFEHFDPDLVDKGRASLVQTNLFSIVQVNIGTELDDQGRVPVTYNVTPRLHRSIGGGVGYQTDVGFDVHAFWENRNLFGAGERLRAEATWGQSDQEIDLTFRKPDIFVPRLALLAEAGAASTDTDAYDSDSVNAGTGLEYAFTDHVTGTLGIPPELFNWRRLEWYGQLNVLKGGLVFADAVVTVSPNHARELCTPDGGFGLHGVFSWLGPRFVGILNGIDQRTWDPSADTYIAARYGGNDLGPLCLVLLVRNR